MKKAMEKVKYNLKDARTIKKRKNMTRKFKIRQNMFKEIWFMYRKPI
jgi:hypothetical protein